MAINFGGLATGMDTNSLIEALMKAERRPIERLQDEKNFQNSRLNAFSGFDSRLKTLLMRFEGLDTANEVRAYKATATDTSFFSVSGSADALAGNFQVQVKNLAQVQKDVSLGYASRSEALFGSGTLTINGTEIAYDGDSLNELAAKINAANTGDEATGVSASIINDGSDNGFRLVLTGKDSGTTFAVSVNAGPPEEGEEPLAHPSFSTTQEARLATIVVDNIEIKSKTNVFDQAIPGVTLTLNKAHEGDASTAVNVSFDKASLKGKIQGLVSAYNDVMNYISQQANSSWGRDSSFRSVQGRLQSLLVTSVGGEGNIRTLSQLGLKTDAKAGTLTLDGEKLDKIIDEDFASLEKLLAGKDNIQGIAKPFTDYLKGLTHTVDGLFAGRKKATSSSLRQIDASIDRNERRLEQREQTLRTQFESLETLVSSMNATSNYLSQQINLMNNLWSRQK